VVRCNLFHFRNLKDILHITEPKEDKPSIPEFIKVPEKIVARERDLAQFIVKVIGTPKPTG
jgi:hypothetical protein